MALERADMTPEQFVYWLQGYAEISGSAPTEEQWQVVKDHLQLVFKKETPAYLCTRQDKETGVRWYLGQPPVITC